MNDEKKLQYSLLFLRATIFLVMFMWTVDKFVNPGHAIKIFEHFYFISGMESLAIKMIGAIELALLICFLVGYQKKYTYGFVLLLHAGSTLSSFNQYLSPFEGSNLLFFAAWPMLAACFSLFIMRDSDKLLCINR
ncbi:MAG: putative oxidoreductase [Gammaproteobacteria bacterium]|jgi:putative oxidoreductase